MVIAQGGVLLTNVWQIDENSTLPTTISSIQILGAKGTRRGFLERIFNPLLAVNNDRPFTLSEALSEVSIRANQLSKFGETDFEIML